MNFAILIFIVTVSFVLFGGKTTNIPSLGGVSDVEIDELAICLTDKGAIMYGTNWCGHCKDQKAMFGNSFQYINFVDCDENTQECVANSVQGYPTWKINNQLYPGVMELSSLKQLSGC